MYKRFLVRVCGCSGRWFDVGDFKWVRGVVSGSMADGASGSDGSVVRKMAVERGPSWVNDFKAWVGRRVK